jgi:hypothetical protein
MAWSNMVDLALTDNERAEMSGMVAPALMESKGPQYPYGTRITLCEKELDKLKLDIADAAIGDLIDMRCFGVITSLSQNDGPDGPCCRVEIQIQRMAVENEATEEVGD